MENMENKTNFLEVAKSNFKTWNDALQTKDAKRVAELYSEDNTFLPTMSGEFKSGEKEAEGYFEHFLLKNPLGRIVQEKVQPIGDNSYLHSGLYNFEVDKQGGGKEIIQARFTYLWQKDKDGNWKIHHHHSSVQPK
jgi:uncharacterized protein (TIGR02246 family)